MGRSTMPSAVKAAREIVERIMAPITAAVAGYREELNHMLNADDLPRSWELG